MSKLDKLWILINKLKKNPQYSHYAVGVRDRCQAPLLLEHSVEGPLGYRWLIRHDDFGDIHCRQGGRIFISIISPSDLKGAGRDTRHVMYVYIEEENITHKLSRLVKM